MTRRVQLALVVVLLAIVGAAGVAIAQSTDPATADGEYDSVEEVQQEFDPQNDPEKLVDVTEDGKAQIVHVYTDETALPEGFPTLEEAGVKTVDEYHEYIEKLNATAEPTGDPGGAYSDGAGE